VFIVFTTNLQRERDAAAHHIQPVDGDDNKLCAEIKAERNFQGTAKSNKILLQSLNPFIINLYILLPPASLLTAFAHFTHNFTSTVNISGGFLAHDFFHPSSHLREL